MNPIRIIAVSLVVCGLVAAEQAETPKGIPVATLLAADTDTDGALSQAEWRTAVRKHMQQMHGGMSLEKLNAADQDGDGRLSREELRSVMQAGPGRGQGRGQDKNRGPGRGRGPGVGKAWQQGPIPLSEIIAFDTDADGFLSRDEIMTGMRARCGTTPDSEPDAERRGPPIGEEGISLKQLRAADSNNDGTIDREEFRAMMHQSDE